ncbi:MAG: hypothetical protein VB082_07505 [Christensenella sp.]|nr:hypothetical protein [Christensenella sp.]
MEDIDTNSVLEKLNQELLQSKRKISAQEVISSFPVTICPICMNELTKAELIEGLCPHCKTNSLEQRIEQIASYRKLIEDSIKEAQSLKKNNSDELREINKELNQQTKEMERLEHAYFEKITELKTPLDNLIAELKSKIEQLSNREYLLKDYLSTLIKLDTAKNTRDALNDEIKDLQEQFEDANRKSVNDIEVFGNWQSLFKNLLNYINGSYVDASIDSEEYIPLINGLSLHRLSQESMKVMARLSYILSLALYNTYYNREINSIGFAIFDSPRDKDLDLDKYGNSLKKSTL